MNTSKKILVLSLCFSFAISMNVFFLPAVAYAVQSSLCPPNTNLQRGGLNAAVCVDEKNTVVKVLTGLESIQAAKELGTSASSLSAGLPTYSPKTSCNFEKDWFPFFDPGCWIRALGAFTTSVFVYLGVKILTLAGFLFNALINDTIVTFGPSIYDKVKVAVETGWTAFRDIANILIIGIFTFIAISIILA